jgi:arginine N-succinyltransferase
VLECHVSDLRTVRESVVVPVEIGTHGAVAQGVRSLVSNTSSSDFRVGFAAGTVRDGVFTLNAEEAAALHVAAGEPVRVLGSAQKPQ